MGNKYSNIIIFIVYDLSKKFHKFDVHVSKSLPDKCHECEKSINNATGAHTFVVDFKRIPIIRVKSHNRRT